MRSIRVLAAASALLVGSAVSLHAVDQKDFLNLCTPGAIRACTSISVITNWTGSYTSVTIRVRNLQGGLFDNSGGSLIQRIGLVAPHITGATGLSVHAVGGATAVNNPQTNWTLRSPGGLGGLIEMTAGPINSNAPGGIRGCGVPFGGNPSSYFQTCNTGWVELTFTTTNNWSANNAEIAYMSKAFAVSGSSSGIECGSNFDPTSGREQCVVATPEPMTMLLLGSGLASMGGFGLVRRRKGHDVTTD